MSNRHVAAAFARRRTPSGRLAVLLLAAFLALEILGRCCCLPAAAPTPAAEPCHGGHHASAPASPDGEGCSCELHVVAVDVERSSGAAAPLPEGTEALPLLAVLLEAPPAPPRLPEEFRTLPPPEPEAAPPGLRAPPRS